VAAHGDVVGVDEGGGVAVVVPDRSARPEEQMASSGRAATGVDLHGGALLERVAGQDESLASVAGIQFPAGQVDGGGAGVADQCVLAVEVAAVVAGGVGVDAGDRGPVDYQPERLADGSDVVGVAGLVDAPPAGPGALGPQPEAVAAAGREGLLLGGVPGPSTLQLGRICCPRWAGATWPLMVAVRPRAMLVRFRRAVRRTPTRTAAIGLVLAA
jgi:hypothetical protein